MKFVKRNFLAGQTFADLEAMNDRVKAWITDTAGQRIHGTTKETPLGRFHQVEQAALQPLPMEPVELMRTYRLHVHRDSHVQVDGRYYSVPHKWVGKQVDVYVGRRLVEIYHQNVLLTTHLPLMRKGSRSTRKEHYPESKRQWLENPPERCRERARQVGEFCSKVVDTLLDDRVQDRLRSVQALLRLKEKVGPARLEKSCQRAWRYGDPSFRRVKSILNAHLDEQPLDEEKIQSAPSIPYRFARPGEFFLEQEGPSC